MTSLVLINHPGFEDKIQTGLLSISAFLVKSHMKELRNSKTNYNIDMKLGPLSSLEKRDTLIWNKFDDGLLLFFQF